MLVGDILISAGTVANLGVFSGTFRTRILKLWLEHINQGGTPPADHFTLEAVLTTPMEVRKWRMNGLPSD